MKTNTNTKCSTGTSSLKRGKDGRFATIQSKPVITDKGIQVKSSLIKSVTFNPDNTVSVVLKTAPNTEYRYKSKAKQILMNAAQNGVSLGSTFSKKIRGAGLEVSKTIYAK